MTEREVIEAALTRLMPKVDSVDHPLGNRGFAIEGNVITVIDEGYTGFVSVFTFDDAGALVSVGSWE